MIGFGETAVLAYTKLKTRKVRLIVTLVISSLLFSGLVGASLVFRGVIHGVEDFNQEGFGSRYIIGANSVISDDLQLLSNKDIVNQAILANKDIIKRKKIEAKRLGLELDTTNQPLPYIEEDNGQGSKVKTLDQSNEVVLDVLASYKKKHPDPGLAELKKQANGYGPIDFYETKTISSISRKFGISLLDKGKESFDQKNKQNNSPFSRGTESFTTGWTLMSSKLLKPFTSPDASLDIGSDGSIPVVAPFSAVEQLLSLEPLAQNASSNQKLDRIKEVRSKSATIKFEVCYRNSSSIAAVDQAVQLQQEILRNKDDKKYQKPNLIYDLPEKACNNPKLIKDTRTALEKKQADKQKEFDRIFGEPPVVNKILTLRVVGVAPDPPEFASFGVSDIFASILTSNVGSGWYTPLENQQKVETLGKIFKPEPFGMPFSQTPPILVELSSAKQTKDFVDQQACKPEFGPNTNFNSANGPYETCIKEGKNFDLAPFGSNSLAIVDIKKGFSKFFRIAAIVVAVIAGIIMMGTLGRIIADSRRETAVFRAIGAKRLDIAQIYLAYTVMVSLMVVGVALLLGFIMASIADAKFSSDLTIESLLAYNSQDLSRKIHLYAFEAKDILYIGGFALLAGLASAIIPLVSNLRRNPIRDMRDEN